MMKSRQSGVIASGYIYLVGAIVILALVSGIVGMGVHYLNGVQDKALQAGLDQADAAYKARDVKALTDALARVQTLEDAARKAEAGHVQALAKIGDQLTKEKANAKNATLRVLDDINAGKLRVRTDAFQARECPAVSDRGQGGETGSPAGERDGACRLSDATASAVLAIGADADARLTAAQAVILEDRRICGPGT